MRKPKFLYHASPIKNISVIEPRIGNTPKDFNNGPVVFASDSRAYASFFLVPLKDVWSSCGSIGNVFYFACGDKLKFEKSDQGGSIYVLLSKTFTKYNGFEWYSTDPVKPTREISVKSALEEMLQNFVQVYFVEGKVLNELERGGDHINILGSVKSENENRGLPFKPLG